MVIRNFADVKVQIKTEDILKKDIIYCLTFPNGKKYIGLTTQTLKNRIIQHCNDSFKLNDECYNTKKSRAVRKYMKFSVDILYQGDDLNLKEIEFIKELDTFNNGYNSTLGGEGIVGFTITEETRLKMSDARKEWAKSEDGINHFKKLAKINSNRLLGTSGKTAVCSLKVNQFSKDGQLIKEWNCIKDIERELGILHTAICNNLNGLSKTSGGFIWKYNK